jgi:hypothetical protein
MRAKAYHLLIKTLLASKTYLLSFFQYHLGILEPEQWYNTKPTKWVEHGCLQMRLHSAIKVLSDIILGAPPTPSACP